ncbi:YceI family protein [Yoonia sp. 208BN28-4]|uniref:YceI family protein n=1 Tax=Yoonia sp. 208BN28-4 TaxID=3126505 RepID=UPI0030ACAEDD
MLTRRTIMVCLPALIAAPKISLAAPVAYRLDAARSQVGFSVTAAGEAYAGTMPITSADLALDFGQVSNSRVSVTLRPAAAQMGIIFATQALKSAEVLDTARFPLIQFESTSIRTGATSAEAVVNGRVTVRGVTQPISLAARLSQQAETVGQTDPELTLVLTGGLDRHAFGASGYASLVAPTVALRIVARIRRA